MLVIKMLPRLGHCRADLAEMVAGDGDSGVPSLNLGDGWLSCLPFFHALSSSFLILIWDPYKDALILLCVFTICHRVLLST